MNTPQKRVREDRRKSKFRSDPIFKKKYHDLSNIVISIHIYNIYLRTGLSIIFQEADQVICPLRATWLLCQKNSSLKIFTLQTNLSYLSSKAPLPDKPRALASLPSQELSQPSLWPHLGLEPISQTSNLAGSCQSKRSSRECLRRSRLDGPTRLPPQD